MPNAAERKNTPSMVSVHLEHASAMQFELDHPWECLLMEDHESALSHSTLMQAVVPHKPGTRGDNDTI